MINECRHLRPILFYFETFIILCRHYVINVALFILPIYLFSFFNKKGKADSLKFEWLPTPWSKCSQTCGGSGFQVRAVQCIVRLNNVTKSVEAALCEDARVADPDRPAVGPSLRQPVTVQKCGLDTCPKWVAGSWTPCHQSRCFTCMEHGYVDINI